ncbi:MAG: hypothetical protein ABGX04_02385 [Myxococcales bacterium]|nr:hypothetical protein [Myxococcales bacterium]HIK84082.1 hypothetical protein [Myxococcales bacterium]
MTILASIGVSILMAAFLGNLMGRLESTSPVYQGMNAVGAGIAAYASYGIGFIPFVVLEGMWCLAALVSLIRTTVITNPSNHNPT